jgi:hypothetical protein
VSFYVDGTFAGRVATTRPLLAGASELVELRFEPVTPGTTYSVTAIVDDPDHEPLPGLNECRTDNDAIEPFTAACPTIG